jgi:hypothetical protein
VSVNKVIIERSGDIPESEIEIKPFTKPLNIESSLRHPKSIRKGKGQK